MYYPYLNVFGTNVLIAAGIFLVIMFVVACRGNKK